MKKLAVLIVAVGFCVLVHAPHAQTARHDKAAFVEKKDAFKDDLEERARTRDAKPEKKKTELKMDLTGLDLPTSPSQFTAAWHFPPASQDLTGSCWAFSSVSFFESEIHRLSGRQIKLSEMFTVYWEYVEKARRLVRERGDSVFSKGSQPNATPRIWKQYGVVPAAAYGGRVEAERRSRPLGTSAQDFYDDNKMFAEMNAYLESVKASNAWNEDAVLATIQSILNRYIGAPPKTVIVDGKEMTPQEYLRDVLRLNMDNYVNLMSLMQEPYYRQAVYDVADNWWRSAEYYNVPLDEFIAAIKRAVRAGYTVCIAGDNSEPGFAPQRHVALIPTFDIPAAFIDQYARQMRFSNESTSDDHAIHLVGYLERDPASVAGRGKDWYLIKDSQTKLQVGGAKGYIFYHEDFVKLKIMNVMLHRDAIAPLLEKFPTQQ